MRGLARADAASLHGSAHSRKLARMARNLLLLLVCVTLQSCFVARSHIDQPLKQESFAELTVGTSTAADAARLLGAPNQVVEIGDGSAWLYRFTKAKRSGLVLIIVGMLYDDTQSDRIWLFFDADGNLTESAGTFEAHLAEWGLP